MSENQATITPEMIADAMQAAWDEFTADTGAVPDCFERQGRRWFADFHAGNFKLLVANHLAALPSRKQD